MKYNLINVLQRYINRHSILRVMRGSIHCQAIVVHLPTGWTSLSFYNQSLNRLDFFSITPSGEVNEYESGGLITIPIKLTKHSFCSNTYALLVRPSL